MSLCPINGGQCCCQPQEGVACRNASAEQAIKIAYETGLQDRRISNEAATNICKWAEVTDPIYTDFDKGYEAAKDYVRMQLCK